MVHGVLFCFQFSLSVCLSVSVYLSVSSMCVCLSDPRVCLCKPYCSNQSYRRFLCRSFPQRENRCRVHKGKANCHRMALPGLISPERWWSCHRTMPGQHFPLSWGLSRAKGGPQHIGTSGSTSRARIPWCALFTPPRTLREG